MRSATQRLKVPNFSPSWSAGSNMIMIHDGSFEHRQAEDAKVPAGYGDHFKSYGRRGARTFLSAERCSRAGSPNTYVLAGSFLRARSDRFAYFVDPGIASGRVEWALPLALRRCG